MLHRLLRELHCPYCGGSLELEAPDPPPEDVRYGALRCACYRYPIIEGIVVLRQDRMPVGSEVKAVVGQLAKGQDAGALLKALESLTFAGFCRKGPGRRALGTIAALLKRCDARLERRSIHRLIGQQALSAREAIVMSRPVGYGDYFVHRYANPSFLSAVAAVALLRDIYAKPQATPGAHPRVLDLACGAGHSSYLIGRLFPGTTVISADYDFMDLYLTRRYIAPDAQCICLDAEAPLPFADGWLDAALCLDAFHYIHTKAALVHELARVVGEDGLFLFPHLHNALAANPSQGVALSSEQYRRCFAPCGGRLFAESAILKNLIGDDCIDLSQAPTDAQLRGESAFWLAGCRQDQPWRRHAGIGATLARPTSSLAINPIYGAQANDGQIRLEMRWPSQKLRAECARLMEYLPQRLALDAGLLGRLGTGLLTEGDIVMAGELARSFALVHLPDGYTQTETLI